MIFLQENLRNFFFRVSKNGFSCQYNKLFFKQEFLVLKNVFWGTSLKIFLWAENIYFWVGICLLECAKLVYFRLLMKIKTNLTVKRKYYLRHMEINPVDSTSSQFFFFLMKWDIKLGSTNFELLNSIIWWSKFNPISVLITLFPWWGKWYQHLVPNQRIKFTTWQ